VLTRAIDSFALRDELCHFIDNACLARPVDVGAASAALSFVRLAQLEYECMVQDQVTCMASLDNIDAHRYFLYQVYYYDGAKTVALFEVPGVQEATGMNIKDLELREIWMLANRRVADTPTPKTTTAAWARKRARMYDDMPELYPLGRAGPLSLFCNVVYVAARRHIYSPHCDAFRARCFYCGEALRDDPRRRLRAIRLAHNSARHHQCVLDALQGLSRDT
jgi:hypothetical protein